ncbi:hypothetical protein D9V28_03725 [Mycetocola zhadangensis]|uniref:Uncharacterized protein n=1 Tax=Mycetocola zhadangensis TaxID=1164595 RepID=A0A3L7J6I0_9MICO|nr:hypothetical protein D9V28_03725 [Mycetocola zhadangensis]GGE87268.1 hypothetical protein GCM10011313_07290 [Mycetocola zhadangensis]
MIIRSLQLAGSNRERLALVWPSYTFGKERRPPHGLAHDDIYAMARRQVVTFRQMQIAPSPQSRGPPR